MGSGLTHAFKPYAAQDTDIGPWARTIYAEAGGEGFIGKLGVGYVIFNRASLDLNSDQKPDWWGETIEGVCHKKSASGIHQFSCYNERTPEEARYARRARERPWVELSECLEAVSRILHNN